MHKEDEQEKIMPNFVFQVNNEYKELTEISKLAYVLNLAKLANHEEKKFFINEPHIQLEINNF